MLAMRFMISSSTHALEVTKSSFNYSNSVILPFLHPRFETVDMAVRLLVPIIVLQNHNRYNILQEGHNYSIDVQAIEREVS
jgi:aspartate 1-decarboxylase